jgi:SAM-dependent methyltransferase
MVSAVLDVRTRRRRLKELAGAAGVSSADPLWKPLALRQHRRKLEREPAYRQWCEAVGWETIAGHWGAHDRLDDEFTRLHVASQLYELTELLRARIGPVGDRAVLDAGASDGLFLNRLEVTHGVGLNLLEECADQIAADGYEARLGSVEAMPFDDASFPIVICCESLEHLPNAVAALNELARVCSGRIHLTIPWLRRTRVTARPAGWPLVEGHIFEFAPLDFARVLTHADVEVVHRGVVPVFPEPRNPALRLWLSLLMYPNFFPRLQYYELAPAR